MIRKSLMALCLAVGAPALSNDAYYETTVQGSFEDTLAFIEEAIVHEGLVIDYRGHIADMLTRTSGAVGMSSPYANAQYIVFCSAALTHAATTANPQNIAICPYTVYAYELEARAGTVKIGYRKPIAALDEASMGALAQVDALLRRIVDTAAE